MTRPIYLDHNATTPIPAEVLAAMRTPSVADSTGSACHSGRTDPSTVLTAMGVDPARALAAVRLSLGSTTTEKRM
jgi:cysteine desulfurase